MLTAHTIGVFVHILLFVYWLGGDLGVFLLALAAKRPDLSFAERMFALKMATLIDFVPRICFALMFPVGLFLAESGGWVDPPTWLVAAVWLVAAGWIAFLFALGHAEGTPRAATLNRVHLGFQGVMFVVFGYIGIASLAGHGPFPEGWLGLKVLLFAGIFGAGIGIDYAFRPIVPAFVRLATEGSKPDIEAAISRSVDGAIRYVLTLYALLVVIAFVGVTKPF